MPTILIVDDTAVWRHLSRDILRGRGYRLLEADGGPQALALAEVEPVDLFLMDYAMPGSDGLETARQLRQLPACQAKPIILVTSEKFPGTCEQTPVPFVDGYLDKRRLVRELADCVRTHLEGLVPVG